MVVMLTPTKREVFSKAEPYSKKVEVYIDPVYIDSLRSTDSNPIHFSNDFALDLGKSKGLGLKGRVAHGIVSLSTGLSALMQDTGLKPENLRGIDVMFKNPVYPGDTITHDLEFNGADAHIHSYVDSDEVMNVVASFSDRPSYFPAPFNIMTHYWTMMLNPFDFSENLRMARIASREANPFAIADSIARCSAQYYRELRNWTNHRNGSQETGEYSVCEELPPFVPLDEDVKRNMLPGLEALGPSARILSRVLGKKHGTLWGGFSLRYWDASALYASDMRVDFSDLRSKNGSRMKKNMVHVTVRASKDNPFSVLTEGETTYFD